MAEIIATTGETRCTGSFFASDTCTTQQARVSDNGFDPEEEIRNLTDDMENVDDLLERTLREIVSAINEGGEKGFYDLVTDYRFERDITERLLFDEFEFGCETSSDLAIEVKDDHIEIEARVSLRGFGCMFDYVKEVQFKDSYEYRLLPVFREALKQF